MSTAVTTKRLSERDGTQVLQAASNLSDNSIAISGFLQAKIGHKGQLTEVSPTTEDYRFFDVNQSQPTANSTSGSAVVTGMINAVETLKPSMYIFSPNFPKNTFIVSVDSNTQVTMSQTASATGVAASRFGNLLYTLHLEYSDNTKETLIDFERIE